MKFLVALIALLTGMTITPPGEAQARDLSAPVAAAHLLASAEGLAEEAQSVALTKVLHRHKSGRVITYKGRYFNALDTTYEVVSRSDRARE